MEQLDLHYCRCGPKSPLMHFEGRINNDVYIRYGKRTSCTSLAFSHTTVRFWPLILEFSGQASMGDLQRIIYDASVGGCSICCWVEYVSKSVPSKFSCMASVYSVMSVMLEKTLPFE